MRKLTVFVFTLVLFTPCIAFAQKVSPEALYLNVVDYQLKKSGNFLVGVTDDRKIIDGKFVCERLRRGATRREIINTFVGVIAEFEAQTDPHAGEAMREYLSVTSATGIAIFCPEFKGYINSSI
jgi:hypothetical protein